MKEIEEVKKKEEMKRAEELHKQCQERASLKLSQDIINEEVEAQCKHMVQVERRLLNTFMSCLRVSVGFSTVLLAWDQQDIQ